MEQIQIQIEALEQKRSKWLIINMIGFCVWDGSRIIDNYVLEIDSYPLLTGITLLGWLIWVIGIIQLVRIGKELKHDKQALHILNDELVELNRLKSWRFSLIMITVTQVFIIIASSMTDISGVFAAELSIFVLVTSTIGGFLYYNRESNA